MNQANCNRYLKMFVLLMMAMATVACESNQIQEDKQNEPTYRLGKYVYCDDNNIAHIDPNCIKLKQGKDDNGHDIYAKRLIDTAEITVNDPSIGIRVCSHCVSDGEYEHILRICKRNIIEEEYPNSSKIEWK